MNAELLGIQTGHGGPVNLFYGWIGALDSASLNRKMRIQTPLDDDAIEISELIGSEALSTLFSYQLAVQSPRHKQIDVFQLLGQDIRVEIELPAPGWIQAGVDGKLPSLKKRRFCGIVAEVTELSEDDTFRYYSLQMKPRLWLWEKKADCRIFQEQTIPQILKTVFEGLDVKYDLHDQYFSRPYCVQYNESTYQFASRLMADVGIFFYFQHEYEGQDETPNESQDENRPRGERLVITDSVVSLPSVELPAESNESSSENKNPIPMRIQFDDGLGGTRDELRVSKWHKTQRIVTTKYTARDHSFQLPGQSLEANEEVPEIVKIAGVEHHLAPIDHDLEVFEYPGQYAKKFDGISPGGGERPESMKQVFSENAVSVKREIERHCAQSIQIVGDSNCASFCPGHKFVLTKNSVASGPYFLKSVTHTARLNADFRASESPESHLYENSFECQAEVQPFQPERTISKPTLAGYQTATVVGPEGEEVFSDKFGRIKVQFNWDRLGKHDADSSCWIRVSQIWAGNRFGAFFWPRAGHEVVVTFENGDPDQPLIVGSVYNAKNMPPMKLPDRLTSSGITSCTIGGNPLANSSCVVFHDGIGQEYLQLHSETHECLTSETSKLNFSSGPKVDFQGTHDKVLGLFGSGSGGGPSGSGEAPSPEQSLGDILNNSELKNFLDPELVAALDSLTQKGSGSGGMITGILNGTGAMPNRGDRAAKDAELAGVENLPGKFEMITGSTQLDRLGTNTDHVFGRDAEVIADLEALVESFLLCLLGGLPGVPSAISDATLWQRGGHLKQIYGNKCDMVYGHEMKVRRGHEYSVTQNHFFGAPQIKGHDVAIGTGVNIAVRAIAIFILLFDIAMAIAIKCVMENPPSQKES